MSGQPVGVDLVWAGRTLRALREGRGMSQAELARRSRSPRTYLIALEQGRHEPSLDLLGRIAEALEHPLREVLWYLAGEPYADPAAPLAARVRLRRQRLGLRPADLAARAGTTRATISQIESGVNANPGLGLLARLAAALQCCPSELAPQPDRQSPDHPPGRVRPVTTPPLDPGDRTPDSRTSGDGTPGGEGEPAPRQAISAPAAPGDSAVLVPLARAPGGGAFAVPIRFAVPGDHPAPKPAGSPPVASPPIGRP